MARTTSSAVSTELGRDYDGSKDLTRAIAMASTLVDQVVTCAAAKDITLDSTIQEQLECLLACHFYTRTDRVYRKRATGRASGEFLYDPKNPEPYKASAIELDYSGCLEAIFTKNVSKVVWMGKRVSEQIDYQDRN